MKGFLKALTQENIIIIIITAMIYLIILPFIILKQLAEMIIDILVKNR